MPKYIPLDKIPEMDIVQRLWLRNTCNIYKGYYDPTHDEFVVLKEGG